MKNSNTCKSFARLFQANMNWGKVLCRMSIVAALALVLPNQVRAANVLANPGFETGNLSGWTTFGANVEAASTNGTYGQLSPGDSGVAHSGASSVFMDNAFYTANTTIGLYQDVAATAGDVFTADGWDFTYTQDCIFTQIGVAETPPTMDQVGRILKCNSATPPKPPYWRTT